MAIYFVNPTSSSPGSGYLTKNTGAHTIKDLLDNITQADGDIIELTDDAEIDDSAAAIPDFTKGVTVRSYSGNTVKATVKILNSNGRFCGSATIDGLKFQNFKTYKAGPDATGAFFYKGPGVKTNYEISDVECYVVNTTNNGAYFYEGNGGVSADFTGALIQNNIIHDLNKGFWASSGGIDVTIKGNTFYNIANACIHFTQGPNTGLTIDGNIIYDYTYSQAIHLVGGDFSGLAIKNNVIFNGPGAILISVVIDDGSIVNNSMRNMSNLGINMGSGTTNFIIANNIIHGVSNTTPLGMLLVDFAVANCVVDYNDVFECTTAYSFSGTGGHMTTEGPNSLTVDPRFASATDLSLKLDSPCVDAGAGVGTYADVPSDDCRNISRPQDIIGYTNVDDGTDIGAYEKLAMYVDPTGSETAPYDSIAKAAQDFFELFSQSSVGPVNPAMTIMPTDIVEVSSLNGNISEPFIGEVYYDMVECIIRSYPGNSTRPIIELGKSLAYRPDSNKISGIDFIKDHASGGGPTAPNFITTRAVGDGLEFIDCGFKIINTVGTGFAGPGCLYISYSQTNLKIINNVITENGDAAIYMGAACPSSKIINNTFCCQYSTVPSGLPGIYINNTADQCVGTQIINNIIYVESNNNSYGIDISGVDLPDQDYNCIFGVTGDEYKGVATQGANNIHADPLFVNLAGGDLKLVSNSPCLDAGAGVGIYADVPTVDYRGMARPQDLGWGNVDDGTDIGAYEMDDTEVSFSSFSSNSLFSSVSSVSSISSESSESSVPSMSSDSSFSSEFLNYGSELVPSLIDISGGDVPVVSTISVAKLLGFPQ